MRDDQRNRLLDMIQEVHPGYHPILSIAEIATTEENDLRIRFEASKTILPYVEAQLKQVEFRGDVKADFGILRVIMGDEEDDIIEDNISQPIELSIIDNEKHKSLVIKTD